MSAEGSRPRRVAESIRRELAPLLDEMARDAHLGLISITEVEVSPDLRHAVVRVTQVGAPEEVDLLGLLGGQRGRLRQHLGRVLRLRHVPDLRFLMDESLKRQARVDALLRGRDGSDP